MFNKIEMADVCKATSTSHHTPKRKICDEQVYKKSNTQQGKHLDNCIQIRNKCTQCSFVSSHRSSLRRHIRLKHNRKQKKMMPIAKRRHRFNTYAVEFLKNKFACTHCTYSSKWRHTMRRHGALKHDLIIGILDCCGRRFENRAALKQHLMTFHFQCTDDEDDFGQDISLSEQKKAVHYDSNTLNRKNHAGIHEFEDEISVSSTSIDQSFQQTGSCRKIYYKDIRNIRNTLSENEDADETSTFETRIRNSRRTALGRRDQLDIDGLASNGRKGFSKINQVIEESQVPLNIGQALVDFNGSNHDEGQESRYSLRQKNIYNLETSIIKEKKIDISTDPSHSGMEQHLLNRSPALELRRSDRITEQKSPIHKQLPRYQHKSPQSRVSINSTHDNARNWRLQISLMKTPLELTALLERLLEMLASIVIQVYEAREVEIRFKTIECLEYVWNTSKMVIVRWELMNASNDSFCKAIQYIYGTLPVFIDWEKREHLDMLDNAILLSLCTVKNWKPPSRRQRLP